MTVRIGFVGIGAMGFPMARRLAEAPGIDLVVYDTDRRRADAFAEHGTVVASVADAVNGADALFTVLPADRHVETVAEQFAEVARPGQRFIDFSTIGPTTIATIATMLADKGVDTVSVCLTRSTAAAQAGELALFVGGPETIDTELATAFETVATDVHLIGGIESAKAFKLANNMVVSTVDLLVCEALVIARLAGISEAATIDALKRHDAGSWALDNHIERYVVPRDLGPGRFSTAYMAKDAALALEYGTARGAPLLFAALAVASYRGSVALGHRDDYHMVAIDWIARAAAVETERRHRRASVSDDELLTTLARAVGGAQTMISLDALALAACSGLERRTAADLFERGSAGTSFLSRVRDGAINPAVSATDVHRAVAALDPVLESLAAPAITFELAKVAALQAGRHHGADANLVAP